MNAFIHFTGLLLLVLALYVNLKSLFVCLIYSDLLHIFGYTQLDSHT
jgi:hypothetical protein